jgi:hypothetical protein
MIHLIKQPALLLRTNLAHMGLPAPVTLASCSVTFDRALTFCLLAGRRTGLGLAISDLCTATNNAECEESTERLHGDRAQRERPFLRQLDACCVRRATLVRRMMLGGRFDTAATSGVG